MARSPHGTPRQGPPGPEPVTESLIRLLLWLDGPPRRSSCMLAKAVGYTQQRLSKILCRHSRPAPETELAQLIGLATQGYVQPEGWLTPEEQRVRETRRERAIELGQRFASAQITPRKGRRHVPALGGIGARLGLAAEPVEPAASRDVSPTPPELRGRRGVARYNPTLAAELARKHPSLDAAQLTTPLPEVDRDGAGR